MALIRFKDAYPNYRETLGHNSNAAHFDDYSVHTEGDEKVGSIKDALFEDTTGNIRYLIVDTGFWVFGKKILMPIGLARFDHDRQRVYVDGLTKEQVEHLPEYKDDMTIDRNYEERVRGGYRTLGNDRTRRFSGRSYAAEENRDYPGSAALYGTTGTATGTYGATETPVDASAPVTGTTAVDQYDYDREPGLYAMDRDSHHPIRLYQERLIADKDRFKTGSVVIGKRVETDTQDVSVPVERERVVIERNAPTSSMSASTSPDFAGGEVARMDVYAEEADIRKEAFVREEVNVRKEVDRDVVHSNETVRREELDIDTEGNPNVIKQENR